MKLNKISIGTAQFGLEYGIANKGKKVRIEQVSKILNSAYDKGIRKVDTASSYGDADLVLGSIGLQDWEVSTKIKIDIQNNNNVEEQIENEITKSLSNLKIDYFHNLFLHTQTDLLDEKNEQIFESLQKFKKQRFFLNYGVSFYNPKILKLTTNKYSLDTIQVPINILDRRFIPLLKELKNKKDIIFIQGRSIFLQGLLLMKRNERMHKFSKWNNIFDEFDRWNKENDIEPLQVCINFVDSLDFLNEIIIGVQSLNEFNQIIDSFNCAKSIYPSKIFSNDKYLLEPPNWNNL
jgi:aryl-alcohol dehydrogenase-like predicted oxidoreductase